MRPEKIEEELEKGDRALYGAMKRLSVFMLALHLGLFGWMAWHFWMPMASVAAWTMAALFLFGWAFGRWEK